MSTLPIVVAPPEREAETAFGGTLGTSLIPSATQEVDVDLLRKSFSNLTEKFSQVLQDIKTVGDFRLTTVQFNVEISSEGGVALIGSLKAGVKGAVTLTFSV
ncbi:MAG: hypothetical protein H7840_04190 [Alphaproteobacteria bacterium]